MVKRNQRWPVGNFMIWAVVFNRMRVFVRKNMNTGHCSCIFCVWANNQCFGVTGEDKIQENKNYHTLLGIGVVDSDSRGILYGHYCGAKLSGTTSPARSIPLWNIGTGNLDKKASQTVGPFPLQDTREQSPKHTLNNTYQIFVLAKYRMPPLIALTSIQETPMNRHKQKK